MKLVFENKTSAKPKVSIILLDWSCRESFHVFDYLGNQTVKRDQYEVIWIEYYNRRPSEIEARIKRSDSMNKPPVVDKWIVMDIPKGVYYHKHLMYNLGIVAARGDIVTICDSDAIVTPTLVESIIKQFEEDPNIVLHMEEIRNIDKRFHPFNYPSMEEILGEGCINWRNGQATGLLEHEDPYHARNYGACMSALRKDLIEIGGADEHIDYLGHICGPYDITFRLVNAGKREVWHEKEFLYHVWHPGADGVHNYSGPHDGRGMSTTALDALRNNRVMPLVENTAVRKLRLREGEIIYEPLLSQTIPELELENWNINKIRRTTTKIHGFAKRHFLNGLIILRREGFKSTLKLFMKKIWTKFIIFRNVFFLSIKQLFLKAKNREENQVMPKSFFQKLRLAPIFFLRMWKNNTYVIMTCRNALEGLQLMGIHEVAFYGAGDVTKLLCMLAKQMRIKVINIYDQAMAGKRFCGFNVLRPDDLKGYVGKIIVASFIGTISKVSDIKKMGIDETNIIRLQ